MSNFRPLGGQQQARVPTQPRGDTIARYATYLEAQRAVDYLSDEQFPVQAVTIVGTGLRMVERVTGRLTYPRVALAGAASGAWFGLFVGVLLSLTGVDGGVWLAAILFGAGFGVLFGIISYALTGGRRDFTSTSQIVAGEYEVLCLAEQAGAARQLLTRLASEGGPRPGQAGAAQAVAAPPAAGPYASAAGGPYGSRPAGPALPPPPPGSVPSPGAPPAGAGSTAWSPGSTGGTPTTPGGTTPAEPGAPAAPQAPPSGPTYGEMIDRERAQRAERERGERERAEREASGE